MKKTVLAYGLISLALVLVGAGCVRQQAASESVSGLTKEQVAACDLELVAVSQNLAVNPEDPSASQALLAKMREGCLSVADKPPAFHLIKFAQGPNSAEAVRELEAGLFDRYLLLEACKAHGSSWLLSAQTPDRQAGFECQTGCAKDVATGVVSCEGAAYKSPPGIAGAPGALLTETEARAIAERTCIKGGEALGPGTHNDITKTWWFDANLNAVREGCNPACVVHDETRQAEINWRCTGLKMPR